MYLYPAGPVALEGGRRAGMSCKEQWLQRSCLLNSWRRFHHSTGQNDVSTSKHAEFDHGSLTRELIRGVPVIFCNRCGVGDTVQAPKGAR